MEATITPASAGPNVEAPLKMMDCSDTAFIRSAGGTSDGISAERAGWSKLSAAPEQNAVTTTIHSRTSPVSVSTPSPAASSSRKLCVTISSRRLSNRSAMAPPTGANRKKAAACASDTVPSASADPPVRCKTSSACATICIQVPTAETKRPAHSRRKSRWRSARRASNCIGADIPHSLQFITMVYSSHRRKA